MSRPERHDVDYFPFFAKRGKTLNILQNKYGLEGIGFFTNLIRFLALTPDHHYCIKDETDRMNFFAEIGIHDERRGVEMIELMVKTGKLDRELWNNHMVIVSEAFLLSIEDAYKRRSNRIITIAKIREKFVSVTENNISVYDNPTETDNNPAQTYNNPAQTYNNPQSKVKKSKVKKSKEECGSDEPLQSMKDAIELSGLLLAAHRKEHPDFLSGKDDKETTERWARDIERLIRIDKKDPETVRRVILWVKTPGNFWFPNIMSGEKLKKQFERLYCEMQTGRSVTCPPKRISADYVPPENVSQYFKEE